MGYPKRNASELMDTAETEGEVFTNSIVTIGYVRCAADHPCFKNPARVVGYRFVFPRHTVWIHATGSRRYVSDPSIVEYYNDGDEFTRAPIDPRGDHTAWYRLAEADVRDMVRRYQPAAADKLRPLRFAHGPTDGNSYARQRMLLRRIASGRATGDLEVEEAVFDVLDRVLARAYDASPGSPDRIVTRAEREIADRASAVLSGMTSTRTTLAAIGRATGVSVFHLSRTFRKVTGRTLAKHHLYLRLVASLTPLGESDASIDEIATSHGFAGHSHYSSMFRRMFGLAPSTYRHLKTSPRRRAVDSALRTCVSCGYPMAVR